MPNIFHPLRDCFDKVSFQNHTLKKLFLQILEKLKEQPFASSKIVHTLATLSERKTLTMVPVVQLVRASDCGSECRGFESHRAPKEKQPLHTKRLFFCYYSPIKVGKSEIKL